MGHNAPHDLGHPGRVGMNAVRLVEFGRQGDPFQEERVERHIMPGREPHIDRTERGLVVGAEIAGRAHAGEQHRRAGLADAHQDRVEIGLQPVGRQAAQAVIGAELDDRGRRRLCEHPVEPRQPAGAGIARDPGVDHPPVVAPRPQRGFEPGREGVLAGQAEAGGQAVAEDDDAGLLGGRRGRERQEQRAENGSDPRYGAAGGAAG